MFKVQSSAAPEILTEIFKFEDDSYDFRKDNSVQRLIIKSFMYGSETASNLGAKLWDILLENINPF